MFDLLLARVGRALDAAHIRYMVIGGQAVMLYGEPRLTKDIDITLGVSIDALARVVQMVSDAGLEPLVDPQAFTVETMVLPCRDPSSTIRVDLVLSQSVYEDAALGRARIVATAGHPVRYASPEDLVIYKVIAGRPRDLEDVRSIVAKQPALDRRLVEKTLREFEAELSEPFLERFHDASR
jgi:hypothetical protein